tara:strand:+ start:1827 stop:2651 length:825 start_codon:yes stop_codon:yes gene_type:complete
MRVNCAGRLRQGAFAQSFALLGPLLIIRAHILGRSLGRKGKEGRGWQTNQGKSTMPQLALDLPQSSEPCDLSQRFGGVSLLARLLVRHVGENAFAQAHRLIEEHRDVGGVVEAARTMPAARLQLPAAAVEDLCLLQDLALEFARDQIDKRDVIGSFSALLAYVKARFQHRTTECVFVLLLDRKNKLIGDRLLSEGTIDHAPVYPREIAKLCLLREASAIILVHPHPSGDPTPSPADITMTKHVADVLKPLGVVVHDHIIVGRQGMTSFKTNGLL